MYVLMIEAHDPTTESVCDVPVAAADTSEALEAWWESLPKNGQDLRHPEGLGATQGWAAPSIAEVLFVGENHA